MTTPEYMDAMKAALGLQSDYALHKVLGVAQQTVSSWRKGKSTIDNSYAPRVAEILGLRAEYVLVDLTREREQRPEIRAFWQKVANKFARAACMLAALAGFNITFAPRADASAPFTLTAPLFAPDAARNINSRVAALVRIICSVARKAARFAYFGTRHGASW